MICSRQHDLDIPISNETIQMTEVILWKIKRCTTGRVWVNRNVEVYYTKRKIHFSNIGKSFDQYVGLNRDGYKNQISLPLKGHQ